MQTVKQKLSSHFTERMTRLIYMKRVNMQVQGCYTLHAMRAA